MDTADTDVQQDQEHHTAGGDVIDRRILSEFFGDNNATMSEYQHAAVRTIVYPGSQDEVSREGLQYTVIGLASETGEVAEVVKKMMRDDGGRLSEARREKIKDELGDLLWYVATTAYEAGIALPEVAHHNLEKLHSRQERGVLHGEAGNR